MAGAVAEGTSKPQGGFPAGTQGGQWWFATEDGPTKIGKSVPDLSEPVLFANLEPGTYRISLVRLLADGETDAGDVVYSDPVVIETFDVTLEVAKGTTVKVVERA